MADKTDKKEDMRELAQLLTNGINRLGEFLIQSAEEMREVLEAPDKEEFAEEDESETEYLAKFKAWVAPLKSGLFAENAAEKSPISGGPYTTQEGVAASKGNRD